MRDHCNSPGDRGQCPRAEPCSSGGGEKCPDAGYNFKAEPTGLPDRLHMGCERKRNEGLSLDLSNWPHGVAIHGMEETAGGVGLGRRNKGSSGHVESSMPVTRLRADVGQLAVGIWSLERDQG